MSKLLFIVTFYRLRLFLYFSSLHCPIKGCVKRCLMAIFGERKRGGKHCPDKLYIFKVGRRTQSAVTEAVRFNLQGDGKAKITLPSDNGGDDCSFGVTIPENTAPLNISVDVPLDNSTYECNASPVYVCVYGQTCVERNDVDPLLVVETSVCEHCNAIDQSENSSSFTKGHKRNSSSHLYVKGAKNPTENCTPGILQIQNDNNCDAVNDVDTNIMQDGNPQMPLNGLNPNSCPDKCETQEDKVERVGVTESQVENPRITFCDFNGDNNGNNQMSSKLKSENHEPKHSSNMKDEFLDNEGYDYVDSRLDSLDDNSCVINESLIDTLGNNWTESGFDFVDLKLQSLENNTRVINDLNWDVNANNKQKQKAEGTHVSDTYVVKEFLDNKNSKIDLTSMVNDCKDDRNKAFTNNMDDDNANNNIRNRSSVQFNDNDRRTDNIKTDHTKPHIKYKPRVEIPTDMEDILNPNDTDNFPRKRKPTNNEKDCVKDVNHENTQPDTYVRLQEAIQRSFTKFLYEIDLMEFSDSLYEQLVLDMNTYECLFEMWQLDKSKLDAKRKLLLYLSRGQVNKEHFEKAVWKSSHYPLLEAFFPKT